jgi:hypothetical protein
MEKEQDKKNVKVIKKGNTNQNSSLNKKTENLIKMK